MVFQWFEYYFQYKMCIKLLPESRWHLHFSAYSMQKTYYTSVDLFIANWIYRPKLRCVRLFRLLKGSYLSN